MVAVGSEVQSAGHQERMVTASLVLIATFADALLQEIQQKCQLARHWFCNESTLSGKCILKDTSSPIQYPALLWKHCNASFHPV